MPGVKAVDRIHNGIFKVTVESDKREQAMDMYRSGGIKSIMHQMTYNPVNSPNTRYYLTDKIIVKFKKIHRNETIESILDETNFE